MEIQSLKMGETIVELKKSANQIAIRPHPGAEGELAKVIEALSNRRNIQRHDDLGGYKIVEIDANQETVKSELDVLRNVTSVGDGVAVYHTSDDNVPFVPEGTVYLEFSNETSIEVRQELIDKYSLELVESEIDGALTVRVTNSDEDAVDVSIKLQNEDAVVVAEPDFTTPSRLKTFNIPNDELFDRQWHLLNTGTHGGQSVGYKAGADARVHEAWNILGNVGSPNVVIGVIDDGFDTLHPDISTKFTHPWDFTRMSNDVSPVPNFLDQRLGDWHGTACAGVATAQVGYGDVVGAAPVAQLIPVRWGPDLNPQGPRGVAKWFDYMTGKGAWVLSCSWGAAAAVYPLPTRTSKAIARCARDGRSGKGTVIFFAAGNDDHDVNNPPHSLDGFATHPDVIAVAASTSRDEKAHYSNFGDEISICAPSSGQGGWGVVTSDVQGTYIDASGTVRPMGYATGDYTFSFGGTSSSCPLAAGVAALVLGANPSLNAKQVRQVLQETARKIGEPSDYDSNGHSKIFGFGCVDAARAVTLALEMNAVDIAKNA